MPFYIYIMTDGENSKIGFTRRDLPKRLKEYNTHNPTAQLFRDFEFQDEIDAKRIENAVKAFYRPFLAGKGKEWFKIPAEEMASFVQYFEHRVFTSSTSHSSSRILHNIPHTVQADAALEKVSALLTEQPCSKKRSKKEAEMWDKSIYVQRSIIRREFASAFSLGIHRNDLISDSSRIITVRNPPAADIQHTPTPYPPTLYEAVRRNMIDPPFKDHAEIFYQLAPLSSGAYVAFCSTYVSMPYKHHHTDDSWREAMYKMSEYADEVGWTCADHSEWSWYGPSKTGLVIFQPKTSCADTIKVFSSSFRKYVIEHEKALSLALIDNPCLGRIVEDIVYDANFPLDVENFDGLYSTYLHPVARITIEDDDADDLQVREAFEFIFAQWNTGK